MNLGNIFTCLAIACLMIVADTASAEVHIANDRNGVPGMKVSLNDARIRHSGEEVVFYPIFQQTATSAVGNLYIDSNRYVWIDGEGPFGIYMPDAQIEVPSDGEPIARYVEIRDVPLDATSLSKLKIVGRAPYSSKCSPENYYGDFEYVFSDIPVPQFKKVAADASKGLPGGVFTDNEIELAIIGFQKSGGNIEVFFTLTNVGKSNKRIESREGYAATSEGDRLPTYVKIPSVLDSGETVKGTLIINGGVGEDIRSVKHNFYVSEKGFNWHPQLIIK